MKQPGDILLIACYELGHQPLSLASPLGFLSCAGYPAAGIDAAVEKISESRIVQAKFIGIAVPMHTAMCVGIEIARRIRDLNPDVHICFYGLYASLNAAYLLTHGANAVISGEYEEPLLDLIRALETHDPSPTPGVHTQGHAASPHLRRLKFSIPARHSLPGLKDYAHLDTGHQTVMAGYVEASRGCLHTCLHCPITPVYNGRFFVVPADIVLADIRQLVALGARHITFGDPDFLNGPGHALKIARTLHEAFPDVTFDITTKIEHVLQHRKVFSELQALGCAFVVSAVESVSGLVLERLEKGHSRKDISRALEILDNAGVPMRPSLVAFTPWTTPLDYLDMLAFIDAHELIDHIDPIQYTIRLLVPPGSALLNNPETYAWLGSLDQAAFIYHWAHPDPLMETLHSQVCRLVEQTDQAKEDPLTTSRHIQSLACAATSGTPPVVLPPPALLKRRRVPRLTESWFC